MTPSRTLDRIVASAPSVDGVWARDLRAGDWVVIRTKNSVYALASLGDGRFEATGGWFSTESLDGVPVRVAGCTWGGQAIQTGLVAAPGMFVEFENGVRTTRVREVRLMRHDAPSTIH